MATVRIRTSRTPGPLPDEAVIRAGLAGIFETIAGMLGDTRLEPDLDDLLWSFTNVFHRAAERIARDLDRNEDAQRISQREQDGTEVKSVELERLTARASRSSSAATPSRSCATRRPTFTRRIPGRRGGRAPARRSTTRR